MSGLNELRDWVSGLVRTATNLPTWFRVPADRVVGGIDESRLIPGQDYFRVRVHSLRLAYGREWLETYAPLLLVASEFGYDGQPVTRPAVIGPELIDRLGRTAPAAAEIAGTVVAGPSPVRAGGVSITVALHRLSRTNVLNGYLDVVEEAAGALSLATGLTPYVALARAVTKGVSGLTGGDAALVARRDEFTQVHPGYFALIGEHGGTDLDALHVVDGELKHKVDGRWEPFIADHVLYGIERADSSEVDVTQLPLHRQWVSVLEEANRSSTDEAWLSTKTRLSALIGQALVSPDLTLPHAEALEEQWIDLVRRRRDRARQLGDMGGDPVSNGTPRADAVRSQALRVLEL